MCDDRADADISLAHTVNIPIKECRSSEYLPRQSGSAWDEDTPNKSSAVSKTPASTAGGGTHDGAFVLDRHLGYTKKQFVVRGVARLLLLTDLPLM